MKMTITTLADRLQTEADAYEYLEELRWPTGPVCPHCQSVYADFIRPLNGYSRRTRTGSASERRVWRCASCRKQFSVLTGTPLHGTKISVRKWVFVIFEMCSSKNGVAAREIERKYGLCPRTAWFMLHRVREILKGDGPFDSMRGTIVADETWIGGDPKNRHGGMKPLSEREYAPVPITPGRHGNRHTDKIPVIALINADTGEVRSAVIPDVTGATLRKVIAQNVDMAGSHLRTDEGSWYRGLGQEFASHKTVNHSEDEYVRYEEDEVVTSNKAENFFSQLKRSIDGTHHHVSKVHLSRYLAEFDFRYTTRKMSDRERMESLMSRVPEHRLSYKRVTG